MSLFPNAFEGGGTSFAAGPFTLHAPVPSASNSPKRPIEQGNAAAAPQRKRDGQSSISGRRPKPDVRQRPRQWSDGAGRSISVKRDSNGASRHRHGAESVSRLCETEKNLRKLMNRLDEGVQVDGGDSTPMGSGSKQRKKKQGRDVEPVMEVDRPASRPKSALSVKDKQPKQPTKKERKAGDTSSGGSHTTVTKWNLSNPLKTESRTGDDSSAKGLTKLQRGMRTKLEEARFRSARAVFLERHYDLTTASTDGSTSSYIPIPRAKQLQ